MIIGEKIKMIREGKKISQYKLSKESHISQSYLNEIESGKYNNPSAILLNRISKALGVPISELLENVH